MRSLLTLFTILLCTGNALADDLLTMKFENLEVNVGGQSVRCEMYYVLAGHNGSLHEGTFLQFVDGTSDSRVNRIAVGHYQLDLKQRKLTINWPPAAPGMMGRPEINSVHPTVSPAHLVVETIAHHDGSQVGKKLTARIVNIRTTPKWIQDASLQYLLPARRIDVHRMEMLRDAIRFQKEINAIWDGV
ncbi:MAG: hypothetical protein ACKO3T_28350 [Planctomycetaceae bacterium]